MEATDKHVDGFEIKGQGLWNRTFYVNVWIFCEITQIEEKNKVFEVENYVKHVVKMCTKQFWIPGCNPSVESIDGLHRLKSLADLGLEHKLLLCAIPWCLGFKEGQKFVRSLLLQSKCFSWRTKLTLALTSWSISISLTPHVSRISQIILKSSAPEPLLCCLRAGPWTSLYTWDAFSLEIWKISDILLSCKLEHKCLLLFWLL